MGSQHKFNLGEHECAVEIRLEGSVFSPFMQFYTYRLTICGCPVYKCRSQEHLPAASPSAANAVDVEATFSRARRSALQLTALSEEDALCLHSLYRQATQGNCNIPPPSMLQFQRHMEWQAWKMCEGVPKQDAMLTYIAEVNRLTTRTPSTGSLRAEG